MAHFREQYPGMQFKLNVVGAAKASQMVIDGEADISVTYSLGPVEGLNIAYRESGPIFALMRRDHPLAARKLLSLNDLSPYPLALPEEGSTVRQLFDIACGMRGLLFAPVFTSHSLGAVYRFTARSPDTVALGGFLTVQERAEEDGMALVPWPRANCTSAPCRSRPWPGASCRRRWRPSSISWWRRSARSARGTNWGRCKPTNEAMDTP
jgi:DNA-binding transcriptional LysR family regulator